KRQDVLSSGCSRSAVRRFSDGLIVSPPLEVLDLRVSPEIFEQLAAARRLEQARHFAVRIVEIAEDECFRRTGLHARGLDLAVLDVAFFSFGLNLYGRDPLCAERALLSPADFTTQSVGVPRRMKGLLPPRAARIQAGNGERP